MKRFFDLKDLGVGISLSNLWFIAVWKDLLYSNDKHYFDFELHQISEYLAVLVNVLLFTVIFFVFIKLSKSSSIWKGRLFQIITLGLGLLSFGALSSEIIRWY